MTLQVEPPLQHPMHLTQTREEEINRILGTILKSLLGVEAFDFLLQNMGAICSEGGQNMGVSPFEDWQNLSTTQHIFFQVL